MSVCWYLWAFRVFYSLLWAAWNCAFFRVMAAVRTMKKFCWRGDRTHQDWYKLMSKIDVLSASTWLTPRRILIHWCTDCVKPTIYRSSTSWDLLVACVSALRVSSVLRRILIFDNTNFISEHLYCFFLLWGVISGVMYEKYQGYALDTQEIINKI